MEHRMIDWNRPVRTKDGRAVRVICMDYASATGYPVLTLVKEEQGDEAVYTYTMEGKYYRYDQESVHDLENVPDLESVPTANTAMEKD